MLFNLFCLSSSHRYNKVQRKVLYAFYIACIAILMPNIVFGQCNAGSDRVVTASSTVVLSGSNPNTGTWSAVPSNPAGASLQFPNATGEVQAVLSPTASGNYQFVYTSGSCNDTVSVSTTDVCNIYPNPGSSQSQSINYSGSNSLSTGASRQGSICSTAPLGSHVRILFTNVTGSIPPGTTAYFTVTQGSLVGPAPLTWTPLDDPIYISLEQLMSGNFYFTTTVTGANALEFKYYIQGTSSASFGYTWRYSVLECSSSKPQITPTTAINTCPNSTVNLTTLPRTGTIPSGSTVVWSQNYPPDFPTDTLTSSQAATIGTSGTYYAYYRNTTSGCFSAPDSVVVDIINCPTCNLSATANNNQSNVSCNGGSDGSTTAVASGNTGAVTYLWSNGETTATINGLTAGNYTVTITETPTCTATASTTITQPTALSLTCDKTDATTNGGSDGTASVSATGGTSPYTYAWTGGATTSSISGKTAGMYIVTVTDNNGCTASCSSTINEPNAPNPPDLSLTKTVNTSVSTLGGTVTFTLTLTNDNGIDATGVVVTDYLPTGVTFVSTSDPANATLVGNNVVWNVGTFLGTDAPKTLTITVTANAEGSFINNAEITATNEGDDDSTPNNDVTGEDDQDQACFSVPVSLCSDNTAASITVTANTATSYQWYVSTDNGATYTALSGETAQSLVIDNALMGGNGITKYFKVAYNGAAITDGCGNVMCCPVIVTTEICTVCPPPKCLIMTVTRN